MPFVRFSRDKRGYEHVYLVHVSNRQGKSTPARVLYWFRTPPGVKVGRQPFDETTQRAIESHYPGLEFDWKTIAGTPMPPPPVVEPWRERRRAERSARQERAADGRQERIPDGRVDEREHVDDERLAVSDAPPEDLAAAPSLAPPSTDHASLSGAHQGERRARRRRRRGSQRRRPTDAGSGGESQPLAPQDQPFVSESIRMSGDAPGTPLDPSEDK